MKKNQITILDELDQKIEKFRQVSGNYPTKIITDKKSCDKIFEYLILTPTSKDSWAEGKDNYRGIPIEIKEDNFLKLEK